MNRKEQEAPKETMISRIKRCENCISFFYDRDDHTCFITDEKASSIKVCRMKGKRWLS